MEGFNFFNISKNFLDEFYGIAGSQQKADIVLSFLTYQEGDARPVVTHTTIKNCKCLITLISKSQIKYLPEAVMLGRRMINVRIANKHKILKKYNIENINAMKLEESYVIWDNERYNITAFDDRINSDFIHFYCSYGGLDN